MFERLDKDGSGALDMEELGKVIQLCRMSYMLTQP